MRDVKDRVNTNGRRKTKSKGHSQRLGDDGKGSDFLLSELVRGAVGAYVISVHISVIADSKRWGFHAILVCVLAHGLLSVLHAVSEVPVDFVEVDGEMSGA